MPTNEERREIAARLREAEIDNLGFYGFSAHLGEAIGECVRLVSGHEFLVEGGLNRLADLIEPEPERTCRMTELKNSSDYDWRCNSCEECFSTCTYMPSFCPNCGARVVRE